MSNRSRWGNRTRSVINFDVLADYGWIAVLALWWMALVWLYLL